MDKTHGIILVFPDGNQARRSTCRLHMGPWILGIQYNRLHEDRQLLLNKGIRQNYLSDTLTPGKIVIKA